MIKSCLIGAILLALCGCGTSREFFVVKYSITGKVIASYHLKSTYPRVSEEGVSFFMGHGKEQQFIQLTGNVDVIETTNKNVDEIKESIGINGINRYEMIGFR
ncbi:hypothetical protein JNUCC42_03570 [Brevibacterium sp. JNUCC-42]|nr:hypothetical protein JNUCC42_03570 [Brevibacterium sp. JNUCC-42]